jgi:hypothetical protein
MQEVEYKQYHGPDGPVPQATSGRGQFKNPPVNFVIISFVFSPFRKKVKIICGLEREKREISLLFPIRRILLVP